MAIHYLTPPVRGGERSRLPSTQASGVFRPGRETLHNMQTFGAGGPVTQAIRAMRGAEVSSQVATKPVQIEDIRDLRRRIAERIEADIALLDAIDGDCDLEDENEHGGDVQDEPHDPEEDGDWHEQHIAVSGFDGTNYVGRRA